jgi:ATP-dependent helicase/nuclease subunit A
VSLTDEQLAAVRRRSGPLSLTAAAGSGKTAVLVERFVAAVLQDGLSPSQILAITFTDRAAGELRERVRRTFLELGERAAARDTEAAYVSTIHGFCARLLAAHPLAAGLDPGFRVLDEGVAGRLRRDAFQVALGELVQGEDPEPVALVAAYGPDRLRTMIESVHGQLRSHGQRLPRLPSPPAPREGQSDDARAAAACLLLQRLLAGFTEAYEALKLERAAVDFDDLELLAAALLAGREEIRESWSGRFELVMVDEFQDTNRSQLEILRQLERENLFTVGDGFQAIYGFRHAEVAIFRERAEVLSASGSSLALTLNFRSRPALVATVGGVFEGRLESFTAAQGARERDPRDGPAVELLLTQKAGWEAALEGDGPRKIAAGLPRAPVWRQAEARLLAGRVAELVAAGEARPREVVVLLRALGDIAVYERALQQQGLATLASAGAYWESRIVEDLLAYLRVLANPLDEEALYACLAGPLAGLSHDGMALLALAAQSRGGRAFELAIGAGTELGLAPADELALERFCALAERERSGAPLRPLGELIARVLEQPTRGDGPAAPAEGAPAWAAGQPGELANAYKLARLARRFEESEGRDLRGFLDHVAYLKEQKRSGEADAPALSDSDAVRLMSIHAAKGLEFPVVCVADLGRAANKRTPELLVQDERIGLRVAHLDGSDSAPALDYQQLIEERRADEALEEDRILYVAMTRARERLLLSGALELPQRSGQGANGTTMSWLAPALVGDLGELEQQLPPGAGLEGIVWTAATGGEDVRCLVATPQAAAALLPKAPAAPGHAAPESAPPSAPTDLAPVHPHPRGVNPAQLTLEDAVAAAGGGEQSWLGERDAPASPRAHLIALAPPAAIELETVSYSSLKELERCGYRYYLERVLGLQERGVEESPHERPDRGLDALSRGSLVHRVLELHDFAAGEGPTVGEVELAARGLGLDPGGGELSGIAELLGTALRGATGRRIAAAVEVWREHPFAYPAGEELPLLTGVIDVLAREPDGGFLVVDYKSDEIGQEDEPELIVARDYTLQRELYALAVLRTGAPRVEVAHWFLARPQAPAGAVFTAADRDALQGSLEQRLRVALQTGFAVSPRPHRGLCATCPGRSRLCSWPETATMAPDPPGAAAAS